MPPAIIAMIAGLIFSLNNKAPKQEHSRIVGERDMYIFQIAHAEYMAMPEMKPKPEFTGKL